jgi:hypothetical protein
MRRYLHTVWNDEAKMAAVAAILFSISIGLFVLAAVLK